MAGPRHHDPRSEPAKQHTPQSHDHGAPRGKRRRELDHVASNSATQRRSDTPRAASCGPDGVRGLRTDSGVSTSVRAGNSSQGLQARIGGKRRCAPPHTGAGVTTERPLHGSPDAVGARRTAETQAATSGAITSQGPPHVRLETAPPASPSRQGRPRGSP